MHNIIYIKKNYRVNFKKNEKNYEANKSEVFKMVQEADKEPRDLETGKYQYNLYVPIATDK